MSLACRGELRSLFGIGVAHRSIQSPASAPFTAPIPWRRQGVRHTNNEIYFDIEESLDAIIDRYAARWSWVPLTCSRGSLISSSTWGRINANSRLSGSPDLILTFGDAKLMSNCSFHPCIRYAEVALDVLAELTTGIKSGRRTGHCHSSRPMAASCCSSTRRRGVRPCLWWSRPA